MFIITLKVFFSLLDEFKIMEFTRNAIELVYNFVMTMRHEFKFMIS